MGNDRPVDSSVNKADDNGPAPDRLTDRELDVLRWLACGERNRDIAALLCISPRTVDVHVSHILQKLGVLSRTGAVGRAVTLGRVTLDETAAAHR